MVAQAPRRKYVVGSWSATSNHAVEGEVDLFAHRHLLGALLQILRYQRQHVHEVLAQRGLHHKLRHLVINLSRQQSRVSH